MDQLKKLGKMALARMEEPSTWAGVGVGAVVIHTALPGDLGNAIIGALAALGAVLAIVCPEKA